MNRKVEIQQDINWLYHALEYYVVAWSHALDKSTYLISDSYEVNIDLSWRDIRHYVRLIHKNCEVWEIMKPLDVIIIDKFTRFRFT